MWSNAIFFVTFFGAVVVFAATIDSKRLLPSALALMAWMILIWPATRAMQGFITRYDSRWQLDDETAYVLLCVIAVGFGMGTLAMIRGMHRIGLLVFLIAAITVGVIAVRQWALMQ